MITNPARERLLSPKLFKQANYSNSFYPSKNSKTTEKLASHDADFRNWTFWNVNVQFQLSTKRLFQESDFNCNWLVVRMEGICLYSPIILKNRVIDNFIKCFLFFIRRVTNCRRPIRPIRRARCPTSSKVSRSQRWSQPVTRRPKKWSFNSW